MAVVIIIIRCSTFGAAEKPVLSLHEGEQKEQEKGGWRRGIRSEDEFPVRQAAIAPHSTAPTSMARTLIPARSAGFFEASICQIPLPNFRILTAV